MFLTLKDVTMTTMTTTSLTATVTNTHSLFLDCQCLEQSLSSFYFTASGSLCLTSPGCRSGQEHS